MTNRYITAIVGHPNQIQPSHIVITSPYFDTREIPQPSQMGKRNYNMREKKRAAVLEMRAGGALFKDIAIALNCSTQSVHRMYHNNLTSAESL